MTCLTDEGGGAVPSAREKGEALLQDMRGEEDEGCRGGNERRRKRRIKNSSRHRQDRTMGQRALSTHKARWSGTQSECYLSGEPTGFKDLRTTLCAGLPTLGGHA
jgi:hypothetical protein